MRCQLIKLGINDGKITTNMSETMHSVYKRFIDTEPLRLDSCVIAMYLLCNFYIAEIKRSINGKRDFNLKSKYQKDATSRFRLKTVPLDCNEEEIVKIIKDQINLNSTSEKKFSNSFRDKNPVQCSWRIIIKSFCNVRQVHLLL